MTPLEGAPKLGPFDVSSVLRGFVITTFDVDPRTLGARLPPGLLPDVLTLADGRERAFVSAVSFFNTRLHVGFAPFIRLSTRQTNYRAYVRRGDERAVWFFGTMLGTRLGLLVPRTLWRLPWCHGRGEHEACFERGALRSLRWEVDGELGQERLDLRGTGIAMGRLDGFVDEAQTREVLTHPLVGYLRRRNDGPVMTYSVWHAPLALERAEPRQARYTCFERLGLVKEGAAPHSVLVQEETHYLIRLPPRRAVASIASATASGASS